MKSEARAAMAQAGTLPERARGAADAIRSGADRGREALEARGWSPRQTALGVAGGALIGRAVLGRGLLRIPAGLLGASILVRAVSNRPAGRADALERREPRAGEEPAATGQAHRGPGQGDGG